MNIGVIAGIVLVFLLLAYLCPVPGGGILMAGEAFLLLAGFLAVLLLLAQPLGRLMTGLMLDRSLPLTAGFERTFWRLCRIGAAMHWCHYLCAILLFNLLGGALLLAILLLQGLLPLNPQHLSGLSWHLSLNTAISFVTKTNWQSYAGETTISYLSTLAGLAIQNFLSAATGIAVLFALIRSFTRYSTQDLSNAWRDLVRVTLFVLLPLSLLLALFFVSQEGNTKH